MDELDAQLKLRMIPYNARLIRARKLKGLTQIQLSMLVGININTMSHIETLRTIPNPELMEEISSALGAPVNYIFPEELLQAMRDGSFEQRVVELQDAQVIKLSKAFRYALKNHIPLGLLTSEEITEDNLLNKKFLESQVSEVLNTLKPRERKVLELRFGLEDGRSRTMEEVGKEFSVTKERIRQIEAKALRKLRHPARSRRLRNYLE